ncbi:hypothetical protein EGM71_04235 [Stenotrophomonas maltophilia]|nr:hypothetical protein EGM71_04235 [Stenotrophomonas maltophilia]
MENASRFERMERPLVVEPSIVARCPAPARTPEVMQSGASTVQRLHCDRSEARGQADAGHAVNPSMGARSRHPWRSRSCIGLASRLPTVPWPRTVAPSHARRAKRRPCSQYVRNARRRTPFVPPLHPQRNMGNPRGTL